MLPDIAYDQHDSEQRNKEVIDNVGEAHQLAEDAARIGRCCLEIHTDARVAEDHAIQAHDQIVKVLQREEGRNLAGEPAHESALKSWRDRMIDHLSERGEPFVSDGKLALRKRRMLYSPHYPKGSGTTS